MNKAAKNSTQKFEESFQFANIRRALDEAAIIAVTDVKGKIIFANDKFCEISKYSRPELLGQDHRIINSGYHPKDFFRDMWRTIAAGHVWRGQIRNRAKDDSFYWVDTTIIPFLNNKGKPYEYMAVRYEITQQKMAEDAIKELPQRIIAAQEEERKHIAQEIHDDFGQQLIALKIFLANHASDLTLKYPDLLPLTEGMKQKINLIIEKARRLSHELTPPSLKYIGLGGAIKELIKSMSGNDKLSVKFLHRNLGRIEFGLKDILIYRIVQEALTNINKHAEAKNAVIQFLYKKGKFHLLIKDDGKGFNLKDHGRHRSGLGLSLMRERAKLMNGILQVKSVPGGGTQIRLTAPLKEKTNGQK